MTGGVGALPFFIDFMKTFLKDKPKEDFRKAPSMPEDMKELFRQRQRELAAERAQVAASDEEDEDDDGTDAATDTQPKLEQVTLPPPPRDDAELPRRSQRMMLLLVLRHHRRPRDHAKPNLKEEGQEGRGRTVNRLAIANWQLPIRDVNQPVSQTSRPKTKAADESQSAALFIVRFLAPQVGLEPTIPIRRD